MLSGVTFLWSALGAGGAGHSGNIEAGNKAQARLWDNRHSGHLALLRAGRRLLEAQPLGSPAPAAPSPTPHSPSAAWGAGCVWEGREGEWGSRRQLRKRPWHGPQGTLSVAVQPTGQFSSLWVVCTSWPGLSTLPQQPGSGAAGGMGQVTETLASLGWV